MCVPTLRAPLHAAHTGANNECAIVISFPRVFPLWLLLGCFLFIFKLHGNKERNSFHWDPLDLGKKKALHHRRALWGEWARPDVSCSFFPFRNQPPGVKVKRTHQLLEVLAWLGVQSTRCGSLLNSPPISLGEPETPSFFSQLYILPC